MARDFSKSFYNSKEWQAVRDAVLKRDMYLCQHCGRPAEEVHHIIHLSPSNIGDTSVTMNMSNLVSLCKDCHFEEHRGEHGNGRKANESYDYTFDENGMLVKKI
jgi:5-methylcytosine-specific restriction endonuclease McrA